MIKRVIIIVLDSVGIGNAPDAAAYGDEGCNTLGNIAKAVGGLSLPNLERLGLGYVGEFAGIGRPDAPAGSYGIMTEQSAGKDTATGHWEMMGIVLDKPFPTYPAGFPAEIMDEFTRRTGLGWLGNKAASGTEIIRELGEEHLRTGLPIVYTSTDSVFQIAAHEEVIPLSRLYEVCEITRRLLDDFQIGRVIARPFVGSNAAGFRRTKNRRDFSMLPTGPLVLDRLAEKGVPVVGIGKIDDIFCGRGISEAVHTGSNAEGMERTIEVAGRMSAGLIFTNLVDFDMVYGHRNDAAGYADALRETDAWLPEIQRIMSPDDMLVITADHGCDPTTPGTDHTREEVPLLVYGADLGKGLDLGRRKSFADLGATVAEVFGVEPPAGKSFMTLLC
ncbi:MAG: phosphopentomutase [Nitrospirota bacterium]|nr:phosphopentomutase [Nitrospirota bacterium]